MISDVAQLKELAQLYGVATHYWDFHGQEQEVSQATLEAVLTALDVDLSSDAAVSAAIKAKHDSDWLEYLPPSVITRDDRDYWLFVHVDHGSGVRVWAELADGSTLTLEQLDNYVPPRTVNGREIGRATFLIPPGLPLGWHRLHAQDDAGNRASAPLAVTPARLPNDGRRRWGAMTQMYSLSSDQSWGVGDAFDLADVGAWVSNYGADFILINPVHAGEPIPPLTPSPYLPSSRRFLNPLYIRPTEVPEYAQLTEREREQIALLREHANKPSKTIERDRVWGDKYIALQMLYLVDRTVARQIQFDRFKEAGGQELNDFALWCALTEYYEGELPPDLDSIHAPGVAQLRLELAEQIDFYCWLQWIAATQMSQAQQALRECGMEIGVMHDLAVGVHPFGADVWTLPDAFARNISVGAPGDMYNELGQDWSQPPLRPDALRASAYEPVWAMVRAVAARGGAIRIDHIMSLFRLWWIPRGASAAQGTYVRYDYEAMVGVVLLEAYLAGALVIGEDLGTVEPWVRDYLAERGIYGTAVTWFERDDHNLPKAPEDYRQLQLATVNTHDLPPTAAYLEGAHLEIGERLGLVGDNAATVRAEHERDVTNMVGALYARGLISSPEADTEELILGLHRWVCQSNAQLVAVSVVDLVGERNRQNLPGTDQEYPNWRMWLRADGIDVADIDALLASARAQRLLTLMASGMGTEPHPVAQSLAVETEA